MPKRFWIAPLCFQKNKRYLERNQKGMTLSQDLQTLNQTALQDYCASLIQENTLLRQKLQTQQNAHEKLEIAMRASQQGFWYWHSDTNETFYSDEYYQILGYEPQEFEPSYQKWVLLLHPEDVAKATHLQARFIKGEIEGYDIETRMRTKQGEYRWYLTKAGKTLKENGHPLMIGLVVDVTANKNTESALEQEKARLKLALEVAELGMWDWDLTNELYYHTDNYYKILGYEKDEVAPTYDYWVNTIHPEDVEMATKHELDCVAGLMDSYTLEYRMRNKQGDYKWFLTHTKVLARNHEKKATHMIGVIKDITYRKEREIALRQSEEKFRLLIEHNSASVCIFDTEKFYYVNPRFLRTFGYEEKELASLSPIDIIHNDIEVEVNASHKVAPTGKKRKHNRYELKAIAKTGEIRWVDVTTLPIHYAGKNVNIATMYDITKRKQFEHEIREKNEELLASEEELRQNAEELLAMNESLEVAKSQLEQLLETQQAVNAKVEKKSWELYKQKKELKTALKQLQEAQEHLVQSEKMASLGVLVAGIAHELNNPINYISTSAEGLQYSVDDMIDVLDKYAEVTPQNVAQKLPDIEKLKKRLDFEDLVAEVRVLLDNIQSGAKQTAEIVRGLRIFSRVEGGEFEPVDIHNVLDQSLLILNNEYKYDITLEKEYSTQLLVVKALTSKLGQVFVNVIKNAIDAIRMSPQREEKGKIALRTYLTNLQGEEMVVIEIEDNGGGIPEETQKHIFEPFFTTKEVGKGTGLGLPISMGIIENFGGKINVLSTIGKSTKFIVYLPPIR